MLWPKNGWQNGFISRKLFSELYKIMVNKVTFAGFRGGDRPPLDPSLPQPQASYWYRFVINCYLLFCNNFNEALTYLLFFSLKSCEAVISYFILSEVARKLPRFCKMARRSKVVWGSCSGVNTELQIKRVTHECANVANASQRLR